MTAVKIVNQAQRAVEGVGSNASPSMIGTVISNKMQKTVVVQVVRRAADRKFKKITVHRKKFKAHDEKNECQVGDEVLMVESRPLSREKRWTVQRILKKGFVEAVVEAT